MARIEIKIDLTTCTQFGDKKQQGFRPIGDLPLIPEIGHRLKPA